MNFFNVGFGELLLIALIGLLLFGPEDLLKMARTAGRYVNEMQQVWGELSSTLEMDLLNPEEEENQPDASLPAEAAETALELELRQRTPESWERDYGALPTTEEKHEPGRTQPGI